MSNEASLSSERLGMMPGPWPEQRRLNLIHVVFRKRRTCTNGVGMSLCTSVAIVTNRFRHPCPPSVNHRVQVQRPRRNCLMLMIRHLVRYLFLSNWKSRRHRSCSYQAPEIIETDFYWILNYKEIQWTLFRVNPWHYFTPMKVAVSAS